MSTESSHSTSGYRPVGEPEIATQNPWFKVVRQPMDFVDRQTGEIRKRAADGGVMNYVDMRPGVLIVADIGGHSTLLVPQERYTTNMVEGKSVMHYELPGGENDGNEADILSAAERELMEEAGVVADDFILIGNRRRGLLPHPSLTDQNLTVIARGTRCLDDGAQTELNEIIGHPEEFTWGETEDMYLLHDGLETSSGLKIISSAPTVASIGLARAWLARQDELGPKHV